MKTKLIYFLFSLAFLFSACEDDGDDFDYTSAGIMGGEWCVTLDGDNSAVFTIRTSNTAADIPGKMLLTDASTFWDFAVTVNNDLNTLTFSTPEEGVKNQVIYDEVGDEVDYNGDGEIKDLVPYDILVRIKGGKITLNAVELPSKVTADKIEFTVAFEDDETPFAHEYRFVGYRVSGFDEDIDYPYTE